MADIPEAYYARLVEGTLKHCRLVELRKWLRGEPGSPGEPACRTPDELDPDHPRVCARNWLYLFNEVPIAPGARAARGAAPFAMFKAMLAHPWCVAHLEDLLEAELYGGEQPSVWVTSLTSILARVPQGSRLIQSCFARASPSFVIDMWRPRLSRGAWHNGFRQVVDYVYFGVVEKALHSSTLDDVKRLLRLGECCAARLRADADRLDLETFRRDKRSAAAADDFLSRVSWTNALANPRDDVFEYAVREWCTRLPPNEVYAQCMMAEWCRGVRTTRRREFLWRPTNWPGTAMDALETCLRVDALNFPPAMCADLDMDEYGGVGAYLVPKYATARQARDAKDLLAPDWPAQLLKACNRSMLPSWKARSIGCCREGCGNSHGLRTLMADAAFAALDPAARLQVMASIMGLAIHGAASDRRLGLIDDGDGFEWGEERPHCLAHLISGPCPWDGPDPAAFVHALAVATRGSPLTTKVAQVLKHRGRWATYIKQFGLPGVRAALALLRKSTVHWGTSAEDVWFHMYGTLVAALNRLVRLRAAFRNYYLRVWRRRSGDVCGEVKYLPPDGRTCPTGGAAYREGLLSYRRGAGGAFRPPPVHATPELLAWYVTHPAAYSPKADGVAYEGPFPAAYPPLASTDIWPPGDCAPGECWAVRAEEMVVETNCGARTLYLVYDFVPAAAPCTDTLCERMARLRRAHGLAPPSPPTHAADSDALEDFLRRIPPGDGARCVWWPKWVGRLGPDPEESLRELSSPPKTSYKNDGWVLSPDVEQCRLVGGGGAHPPDVKVKPPHEVTADLDVKGAIWRCAWVGGRWEPREARREKRRANPPAVVAALEAYHRRPWQPQDLARYIRGAYYRHCGASSALSSASNRFLHDQRAYQVARLAPLCAGARVLDVGAGRGRLAQLVCRAAPRLCQPLRWVGIDTDPVAVAEARLGGAPLRDSDAPLRDSDAPLRDGVAQERFTWLWCDAATMVHPLTGARPPELQAASFDVILAVHSIHHAAADEETWRAWARNLTALAAPGCTLVVATVDPTRLPAAPTELPDMSFVRPVAGAPSAYRISLAWAASAVAPVTEHYFTPARLTEGLAACGWELAALRRGPPSAQGWEPWGGAHAWFEFRLAS
jgi:SAM-dependent methyltransferase